MTKKRVDRLHPMREIENIARTAILQPATLGHALMEIERVAHDAIALGRPADNPGSRLKAAREHAGFGNATQAARGFKWKREARERLGISQQELARRLGVTKGAISQWENGISAPSRSNGGRLEKVLGIDRTLWG